MKDAKSHTLQFHQVEFELAAVWIWSNDDSGSSSVTKYIN